MKNKEKTTGSKLTSDTNVELSETDINYYVKSIKWEDGEFQQRTGKQNINKMASQELKKTKTL